MTELAVVLEGRTVVLGATGPFTIGRDVAANLRVTHRLVSRQHLVLTGGGALWSGCDLGAANGTYLEGQRIAAGSFFELQPGMELMLGDPDDGVLLRFVEAGRARRVAIDEQPEPASEWQPSHLDLRAGPNDGEGSRSEVIKVGRRVDNDLVLEDSSVSGYHALVVPMDTGRLLVQDLGSTNGTFIDGTRATCQEVGVGAIVSFGKSSYQVTDSGLVPVPPADRSQHESVPIESPAEPPIEPPVAESAAESAKLAELTPELEPRVEEPVKIEDLNGRQEQAHREGSGSLTAVANRLRTSLLSTWEQLRHRAQ
ncbi:FHA domain-containing protein [Propionicimonas sp.]|uniref:FHA domain-containing protein n=1 Tax=Propionicimonas sp. TaxID=1955623 RepID=UPI00184ECEEE|nr:FHA domain-containing protein [Propionicimonas sp.]MBU3977014.1 FHA domain-containing protein [Actinomycetota bacterium]MBA3020585.1 FHA domain-containing protein [Propionicimonas sp.]MBU3984954.1 FHA domain-containing protein [Actinomycetota bacterium]MBU4007089.1 FHA domain-containing protein [Actinomycetota bacterium]MBU4064842.1 FHA domain-containing protein [Actinomycetota bacterium]